MTLSGNFLGTKMTLSGKKNYFHLKPFTKYINTAPKT